LSAAADAKKSSCESLVVPVHTQFEISDEEFSQISQTLLLKRGFNLNAYKDRCVRRRIAIRIRANHCQTVKEYCTLLLLQKYELDHLLKVLTIHVSQFFRNFATFEKLRLEIIPQLFAAARQNAAQELRFCSLGCASGEEPYTLALILAEHFAREMQEIPVTIAAVDVDAATLDLAKKGLFSHERMQELPLDYLQSYFSESGARYQLAPEIMAMVTFSLGDMFDSLLYRDCDLLLCRNVLIYFSREQQEKIFRNIAGVLGRNGFLVLGKSETILGESRALFQTVCPVERVYRRSAAGECRAA
jgi:chemotaxis protein methyltransferase CheR